MQCHGNVKIVVDPVKSNSTLEDDVKILEEDTYCGSPNQAGICHLRWTYFKTLEYV